MCGIAGEQHLDQVVGARHALANGAIYSLIAGMPAETGTPDLRTHAIGLETAGSEATKRSRAPCRPAVLVRGLMPRSCVSTTSRSRAYQPLPESIRSEP
ncbi:hypothetical protein [Cupriavidus basilensis]|uniref:hypothetical protein n=1 Tax=Cupriavidus basilensis TaxID=68895 RepID=UPI000C1F98EE|nr:hypothetical protein [Cupriavidus basilensis]